MKKKQIVTIIVLALICTVGYILSNWHPRTGFFIVGASSVLLLVSTIGYWQVKQAGERIEKNMRDRFNNS